MPISDYVLIDKPSGWLTHSDGRSPGLVEHFSFLHQQKLFVAHRLDRETTGALVFARSSEAAAHLTECFSQHLVKKKYLFLTDRKTSFDKKEVATFIVKSGAAYMTSTEGKESEQAQTSFEKFAETEQFSLWKAQPLTGKTHQIRLHAKEIGLPILGDTLYGGTAFPDLMLHCLSLSFDNLNWETPPPLLMQNLSWLTRPLLANWLCQYDRRQRLHKEALSSPDQTLRLIHDKDQTGFNCDRFGEVLWFYRFKDSEITQEELNEIEQFHQLVGTKKWVLRQMDNRGKDPHKELQEEEFGWLASEGPLKFQLYAGRGWSPGLFLDQRSNRNWVRENSNDKDVLNLFCYTAGFSVSAAIGGARSVTSVDTSKQTLDWAKENFKVNNLDPEAFQFWAMDAREYIAMTERKNKKFDLIICDPPSFARNKKGIFKIDKELKSLIHSLLQILNSNGTLLFSTNYEKWTFKELTRQLPSNCHWAECPPHFGDHEIPSSERLMKSLFIKK